MDASLDCSLFSSLEAVECEILEWLQVSSLAHWLATSSRRHLAVAARARDLAHSHALDPEISPVAILREVRRRERCPVFERFASDAAMRRGGWRYANTLAESRVLLFVCGARVNKIL